MSINPDAEFQIGMLVVYLKTEKQMRIESIAEDGRYRCSLNGLVLGIFSAIEIMKFDEWTTKFYNK